MPEIRQKSIEQYFQDYQIGDPDLKVKILPEVTRIIYDRNICVAQYEKEEDEYKKKQIEADYRELGQKIDEIFQGFLKK